MTRGFSSKMSNHQDAKTWFEMALSDIERIIRSFKAEDYADCAFRIQFCSEKMVKGLVLLYGGQFKKIHYPSIIIQEEILTMKILADPIKLILTEIVNNAAILENLSTIPRYGMEEMDKYIRPESIYTKESIQLILPPLRNIIKNLISNLILNEKKEFWLKIIEEFDNGNKKIQTILDQK